MLNTKQTEQYRITSGSMASDSSYGANGQFLIKHNGKALKVQISDGDGWEHVSVSSKKTPTWDDMCFIKSLFFEPQDCVIQYHPPESNYVNIHTNCLHLWRPINQSIPAPPTYMV